MRRTRVRAARPSAAWFASSALCAAGVLGLAAVSHAADPAPPSGSATILPGGAKLDELWNEGEFTEGVAAAPDGAMYFSDISFGEGPGRILKFDPQSGRTTVHCKDSLKSNGLMFDAKGRLLACCGAHRGARAVVEITSDGQVKPLVERWQGKRFNAPNDLVVERSGRIWFSDPRYIGAEPMELDHQSVYRVDPDGTVTRATTDIEKPNGVILSPDGRTLYVAETNNGSVDVTKDSPDTKRGRMTLNAFPIQADGTLGPKKVLVDFGPGPGTDGMTIDVHGNLYAAVRADGRFGIVVYDPTGKELAYIPTRELPTNCCFGLGPESKTLYVTAGKGLFRIRLKIDGHHPAGPLAKSK